MKSKNLKRRDFVKAAGLAGLAGAAASSMAAEPAKNGAPKQILEMPDIAVAHRHSLS